MRRLSGGNKSPVDIRRDLLLVCLLLPLSSIQQKNHDARRLEKQVSPNFLPIEPNELNFPP